MYHDIEISLRQLYASLQASAYAPHGFGEFSCWYVHVAYAHAIDVLAELDKLSIPAQGFAAAVWYEEE